MHPHRVERARPAGRRCLGTAWAATLIVALAGATAGILQGNAITRPTLTISTTSTAPVGTSGFTAFFQFSEAVTGFSESDIVTNGTKSDFRPATGSNRWQVNIVPTNDGTVRVAVATGSAVDADGHGNESALLTLSTDVTAPVLEMTSDAAPPVGSGSFKVYFHFSESVTGFDASDITVTNGITSGFAFSSDANSWQVDVTPAAGGSVGVAVAAGAAQDEAGNPSRPALLSITADETPPTLTISSPAVTA